jgi:hypothetical protein
MGRMQGFPVLLIGLAVAAASAAPLKAPEERSQPLTFALWTGVLTNILFPSRERVLA